eukprot:1325452-Pyramimonas_sp.AAC.1
MGSSTEGPSGDARMRPPHPSQRSVAPWGVLPKAPVGVLACAPLTEGSSDTARMRPSHPVQCFVAP